MKIRAIAFACLVALFAVALFAQRPEADDVAHGSEKASHEAAYPKQARTGPDEEPKFLGLPAWIFKLINMILFLGALTYFLAGPIRNGLASRHADVQRAAQEARERRERADRVASDIQARLSQLEGELRSIRERAESEGERQKKELLAAAEQEATKILTTARTEVEDRIKHARHELTEFAGRLASDRAQGILKDRMTEADQHRLFRDSLREVEGAGS